MKRAVSLRTKVVLIFIGIVVFVTVAFLLLNIFLGGRTAVLQNQRELKNVYVKLAEMVADEKTTTADMGSYISSLKNDMNVTFVLLDTNDWRAITISQDTVSKRDVEFLVQRLQSNMLVNDADGVKIIEKTSDYTLQRVTLEDDASFLECYGYMTDAAGNARKFIISMPLQFVRNTFDASRKYLFLFSLVCILAGGVMAFLVTNRMTKPILQLSDISKRMSHLDFSARFEGNQLDEIGVLGNNMNEMSSQLERTIRQLRMSNEQLQKEIEEKNHVDDMRKDFISNVSHELKTPIALIQGYAEGLRDFGKEDPDQMEYYCEVIMDEAEKMNRLVKKLSTLNQLEFGEDGLEETTFDIMEMIRETVSNSRKLIEDHQADVEIEGPENCLVTGDTFKIEEVINNYYSNAFNHLKEPNKIRFSFDDLGPNIRISVHNTGDPIPEEDLEKVWIKFYKVDKARTRAYGGSGIGLSIVKAIMDAHHHEYGVYNTEDGVTFWFELSKARTAYEEETWQH
ncbi:MAG: HAMP domain-containing protein [Lachnospiraceae bacterium]|nr:HAMP domain-containing protein [Lachnospiraceae bacterium]